MEGEETNDVNQTSINLGKMLEQLNKEQEELSKRVDAAESEMRTWENHVSAKKMILESLESELNDLRKESMIIENEMKLKANRRKLLVGDFSNQGLEHCSVAFIGIKQKIEKLEEAKRMNAKLDAYLRYFNDEKRCLDRNWDIYIESLTKADESHGIGKTLQQVQRTVIALENKIEDMFSNNGTLLELENQINNLKLEVNKTFEVKYQVDEECQLYEQVIRERKGILSRIELENRMEENRLLAKKKRLVKILDELQCADKTPEDLAKRC